jgi:group II intron reverse transcriptase/maturase
MPEAGKTQVKGISGLQNLRKLAQKDKTLKFTCLLHHINLQLLKDSFFRLNKLDFPDVPIAYWSSYYTNLTENLEKLLLRLHEGKYQAYLGDQISTPNESINRMSLGILVLEDKIVQRAVATLLDSIYEPTFLGFSYGFRPGRECHDALDALSIAITHRRVNWIVDTEILHFYQKVPHDKLMEYLSLRIADPRILRLIRNWLKAGVMQEAEWICSDKLTHKGGVISHNLANIFLHYILDTWIVFLRANCTKGDLIFVRFADRFVVGFQDKFEAELFIDRLRQRLKDSVLALNPDKTRLLEFGRYAIDSRLRRRLRRPMTFNFLGFTHCCSVTLNGKFKLLRLTSAECMRSKLKFFKESFRKMINEDSEDVARWMQGEVNHFYGYFAIPFNKRRLSDFRYHLGKMWFRAIQRRGDRRRITWDDFNRKWLKKIPTPKVLHPYPSERFGAKHPRLAKRP